MEPTTLSLLLGMLPTVALILGVPLGMLCWIERNDRIQLRWVGRLLDAHLPFENHKDPRT